jgi:hypothetical protein
MAAALRVAWGIMVAEVCWEERRERREEERIVRKE